MASAVSDILSESHITSTKPPDTALEPNDVQLNNSDLSPAPPTPPREPSSGLDSPSSTPTAIDGNDADYKSASEEDAEGSPDEDVLIDQADATSPSRAASPSSSDGSGSRKRKHDVDEEDYIQANPELYELRRSGRVRSTKRTRTILSDSDDSDLDVRPARDRRKAKAAKASRKSTSIAPSPVPVVSDEEDAYGSKRDKAERRKRLRLLARDSPAAPAERVSSRTGVKQVDYNEANDSLDEDELVDPNHDPSADYYYDDRPRVEKVIDDRRIDEDDNSEPTLSKLQFLIWWQEQAPYHATWEDWPTLKDRIGSKRVSNYIQNVVLPRWRTLNDPDVSREDKEQLSINKIHEEERIAAQNTVQRIVEERETDIGLQYYVKWNELDYCHCTWENAELVEELADTELQRFKERQNQPPIVSKSTRRYLGDEVSTFFTDQPAYIKHGTLREFQLVGISRLAISWSRGINSILGDEMGLGKTVQSVAFMSWLKHECDIPGPFLIVVPKTVISSWEDTFNKWTPDINWITYMGTATSRRIIEERELFVDPRNPTKLKPNVVLTTYEMFQAGLDTFKRIKWQFLAVDEAHRLKDKKNKLYANFMLCDIASRLLITGTPFQNDHSELVSLLNFLQPEMNFAAQYDFKTDDNDLQAAQIGDLRSKLRHHLIRRVKEDVAKDLPPKTEKIIRVELADMQLNYYKNILTRNYKALADASSGARIGLNNIMIELKKASVHPYLFTGVEDQYLQGDYSNGKILEGLIRNSGKMMLLHQLLHKLKEEGHRVLIFCGFVSMLDVLSQYMHRRDYKHQRIDGQTPTTARNVAMTRFNDPNGDDFAFLLSTRAGGLGINLYTADTVILFDSDWNPQMDLQAMARAHRIGQKKPVTVYRFVSRDTVEEEILERARNKLLLEWVTIERGYTEDQTTKIQSRLSTEGRSFEEAKSAEDISRILRKRGQKMFDQQSNQKKLEDLNIDAVLAGAEEHQTQRPKGLDQMDDEEFLRNFAYTDVDVADVGDWDQIIPKADRDRMAEEEEKRQREEQKKRDEEYVRSLTLPRKSKAQANPDKNQRAAKEKGRDKARERAAAVPISDEEADDDDDSEAEADPKRPLSEKEARDLIQAFQAYGAIEDRPDDIVRLARLERRDFDVVKSTLQEFIDIAKAKIGEHDQDQKAKMDAGEKLGSKKNQKAVMFEHRGQQRLNAETLLRRPIELRMLKSVIDEVKDVPNFRIDEAIKGNDFDVEWGPREDGMLAIGVVRHGFGRWREIETDPELDMGGKFFLNEAHVANQAKREKEGGKPKKPAGPHLIRRINYLMDVIVDRLSGGKDENARESVLNHHRNNKRDIPDDPATKQRQKRRERDLRRKQREQEQPAQSMGSLPHRTSESPSVDRHRSRPHEHEKPYINGVGSSSSRTGAGSLSPSQRSKEDLKSIKHRLSNGERPRSPLSFRKESVERSDGTKPFKVRREMTPSGRPRTDSDISQSRKRKSDHLEADHGSRERPDKARVAEKANHPIYRDRSQSSPQTSRQGANPTLNSHQGSSQKMAGPPLRDLFRPLIGRFEGLQNDFKMYRRSADPEVKKKAFTPISLWLEEIIKLINRHQGTYGSDFEEKCWQYVSDHHWFGGGPGGQKLSEMAKKVREKLQVTGEDKSDMSKQVKTGGQSSEKGKATAPIVNGDNK